MKPSFRIETAGQDITDQILDRFVSLVVTDHSGFSNDRVALTLDDRDPPLILLDYQTPIRVWMGYEEDPNAEPFHQGMAYMGMYYADEIQVSRQPARTITWVGRANDTSKSMKSIKTRSWEQTTIGELVNIIAMDNALTANVHPHFANMIVPHREQIAQSDQGLLLELAEKHGALTKVVAASEESDESVIYFGPRATDITASNRPLVVIQMPEGYFTNWSVVLQMRSDHLYAGSRYYDDDLAGEGVIARRASHDAVNDSEVLHTELAVDEEEAGEWSEAQAGAHNREKETLSFTCVGVPEMRAEARLDIVGMRPGLRSVWLITSTKHSLSKQGGYVTSGECVSPDSTLPEDDDSGSTRPQQRGELAPGSGQWGGDVRRGGRTDGGVGGGGDSGGSDNDGPGGAVDPNPPAPPPDGYDFYVQTSFDNGNMTNPPGAAFSNGVRTSVAEVPGDG